MIKSVHFQDWKSFHDATLYIDPLTVLIGANSSGKSNALDGLLFLYRAATGKDLSIVLSGDAESVGIRGGVEWAPRQPETRFGFSVLVQGNEERTDYLYTLEVETEPKVQVCSESLQRIKYRPKSSTNFPPIYLFRTDVAEPDSPTIVARLYNEKGGVKQDFYRSTSILSQLDRPALRKEIAEGVTQMGAALQDIFILNPIPSQMRNYTPLAEALRSDASNIAGVIAALPPVERDTLEDTLTNYVRSLPSVTSGGFGRNR